MQPPLDLPQTPAPAPSCLSGLFTPVVKEIREGNPSELFLTPPPIHSYFDIIPIAFRTSKDAIIAVKSFGQCDVFSRAE